MMTNAELKAELSRACTERDEAVRNSCGFWGDAPGIETQVRLALDDARMAMFFIAKLIERLPTDEAQP